MPDQVQDTTMKTKTGEADPDYNLILKDIALQVIAIHTEAIQGHNTGINATTTGAVHDDHAPPIEATAINLATTHYINHIADNPHIEVLQLTNPEITVDHTVTILKARPAQIKFTFQQIMSKTAPQEEPKGEN